MPGIAGFITTNPDQEDAKRQLSRMLRCMQHRPAYTHGTYSRPEYGCYLGWVSYKGSYSDCNPIIHESGDVVIIFSGEHFSHDKNDHATNGGATRPEIPAASSLASLYRQYGERFLLDLNGWFAGAIVDLQRKSIFLFNDRFGVHRVYVHETPDSLTFASEAKSILSVRPATRSLDPQGLGHFLGFGCVFGDRTLFSNISLLPAGSCWSVGRPSAIKKCQYFQPATWVDQPRLDPETFYRALQGTLARVLPSYFRSDAAVGLSLTGGLDTRIVIAGMPPGDQPVPCYTYGGVYRECFDVRIAREIATVNGQSHAVLALGPDFFQNFESFAEETVWLTDGCLGLSGAHEIYYSQLARRLSAVRLTGNYGSEILRSHSTFKYHAPPQVLFDSAIFPYLSQATESFAEIRADHPVSFAAFKEVPWNLVGLRAAAQAELILRSPYMDNDLVRLLYQAPPRTRETNETSLRLISDMNPRLATIPTDLGYGGETAGPIATVRKWHRYLQFKAEWYYNAGMPNWVASFDRTPPLRALEPLFLGSHKIDHYRLWFQYQLKDYLHSVLSDSASVSRPYLNRRAYDELIAAHLNGRRNCMNEINKVLTLELVNRLLLERDYART